QWCACHPTSLMYGLRRPPLQSPFSTSVSSDSGFRFLIRSGSALHSVCHGVATNILVVTCCLSVLVANHSSQVKGIRTSDVPLLDQLPLLYALDSVISRALHKQAVHLCRQTLTNTANVPKELIFLGPGPKVVLPPNNQSNESKHICSTF